MNNTMPNWPGWETVRLIGRGSFGAVYEIERDMLGEKEKAALKVITIPQSSNEIEELRDEGYDEASITDTFKEHLKNIVSEYALMRKLNGNSQSLRSGLRSVWKELHDLIRRTIQCKTDSRDHVGC